ncbi:MAG: PQQ-binding-like beta-propeller repeat protein [Labilithrix sp.]|nr:PQQ-binding-like beta-propeller repeat protein [Labilithrix sp.]
MTTSTKMAVALALGLASAVAQGCAGDSSRPKTFSTDWLDDGGRSISEVQARLRGARPSLSTDLVVSVAGNDKIIGTPLGEGAQWTATHALDARPIIAGGVVVVSGGNEVAALDAVSGKKLWARPTGGLPLLGAGDDGNVTAITLSRGAGSTLLIVGRDGSVKRQLETDKAIGDPEVVGGVVFVPWANQYVSAIDAASGDEIGRVTIRDKVSRALAIGGTLYFGELAYVRFDDKIGLSSRGGASRIALPSRELPGTPRLLVPGTEKVPPVANARDRDRLFGRPSADGATLGIDSNRFYASYYRLIFGFESQRGHLAWVRTHAHDFIGGDAVVGGIVLCDDQGKIVVLDAQTGQVAMEKPIGEPIKSCVVQADSYQAPKPASPGPSLGEQITDAVTVREATLATAQRLLLRELATLEDEGATKTLIDIASDTRSVPVLVADARAALATRRNGASHMLAALGRHYDYLHDVLRSPPVGPIADALAAMKDPNAAPLIAARLLDPQITDDDVKRAAGALALIGTEKEMPQLKQFFAMYRGTAPTDEVAVAVGSVAEAMLRINAKEARPLVDAAVKDAMTVPVARARLEALLAATPEKPASDKPASDKPAADKPAGAKPAGAKPADKPAGAKPADKPATKK